MVTARVRFLAATLAAAVLVNAAAQRFEPFVPIGVWYDGLARPSSVVLHDLQAIRALGFNHIKVPVAWAAVEPERGRYAFDRLDQLLALARESGLKVTVQPEPGTPPAWVDARAPDLRLLGDFGDAVTARAAAHPSFHAVDPRVQVFRLAIAPAASPAWSPAHGVWRLDALRSAAGERGWMADLELTAGTTAADIRQWGWACLAHGARGVTFLSWYPEPARDGLVERNGAITDRARASGEFGGIISRNAALFAPLRPRPSHVTIVYNPLWASANIALEAAAQRAMLELYARAFERNLQADFVSAADLAAGSIAPASAALVPFASMLPRSLADALKTSIDGGDRLLAGPRTNLPTARGLESDVRIEGGEGVVQARFLESADALALIAMNYGDSSRTVTFHFSSPTPEAIWQNMETGASVSFVQGPGGLTYRHTFPPQATMVLAIRKRLR